MRNYDIRKSRTLFNLRAIVSHVTSLSVGDMITMNILLLILCFIRLFPTRINHDAALYLQCGNLIASGQLPYVDFVDINPPLIMYLSTVPAYISRSTGLDLAETGLLLVFLTVLWSTVALRSPAACRRHILGQYQSEVLVAAWAGFSLVLLIMGEFGQREHLFMLLYFPFLTLRYLRMHGADFPLSRSVMLGIAAAIGACLKPHFIFIAALPEIYRLVTIRTDRRFIQPEMAAFVVTGLLYALHFALLPETMRNSLFGRWLPLTSQYYNVYNVPFYSLAANKEALLCLLTVVLSFIVKPAEKVLVWAFVRPLSLLVMGGLAMFLIQHKGWLYQLIPSMAGSMMLLALAIGQINIVSFKDGGLPKHIFELTLYESQVRAILLVTLVVLICLPSAGRLTGNTSALHRSFPSDSVLNSISKHSGTGDGVLIISTSVTPAHPALILSKRSPGSRYLWMFPFAMFSSKYVTADESYLTNATESERSLPEIRFLTDLDEDIRRFKPKLIFVRNTIGCQGCVADFNVMDFLTRVGFVGGAMKGYVELKDVVSDYSVFQRSNDQADLTEY